MTTVQVLGAGCTKCKLLKQYAESAVQELGLDAEVEYITDLDRILTFNVMMTPALVIDGVVKSAGHVPSVEKIKQMLA